MHAALPVAIALGLLLGGLIAWFTQGGGIE